jgi:hypothetical protein
MKWLGKFNNPLVLVVQGFAAGALVFFASHGLPGQADPAGQAAAAQIEAQLR